MELFERKTNNKKKGGDKKCVIGKNFVQTTIEVTYIHVRTSS